MMMSPAFRFVFVTLIVSLYAVAQAFCACASIQAADVEPHHDNHMQVQMSAVHDHEEHDHTGHTDQEPSGTSCAHCEDGANVAVVKTTALAPATKIVRQPIQLPAVDKIADNFVEKLPKTYDKLRWYDPPPTATPISLKTRLLT